MYIEMLTGRTSLDDFYGPEGYLETVQRYPTQSAMLLLIRALRADPAQLRAYAMTHMHQLRLRAIDDAAGPEFVRVMASSEYSYFVEFLMPEDQAPWPHAWVKGEATSTEDAKNMVLTAMRLSGTWGAA